MHATCQPDEVRARSDRVNGRCARSGTPGMRFRASGPIVHRAAPVLVLLLLGSLAAAQTPKKGDYLSNVDLCNGSDRMSLSVRINGCTALIASSQGTTALAIAYNNRGNAYTANGDFDRAIP